jgi:glycosyltransferase involved in cell wall biosynthesis
VVICGEDGVSYGRLPPEGGNWREVMQREVPADPARVHFTGRLTRPEYLSLLQVSALHLYLTVPFVLSWSCIEALAAGCLVLGSDVAPVREVLQDGVNGFLVDGRDPDVIASRAADLLARQASLGPVRDRARVTAQQRFDVRQCLAQQSRIVREVAS